MTTQKFTVFLIPQPGGGYQAIFPYYEGLFTGGDTVEEALAMAKDGIETHLVGLVENGESLNLDLAEFSHAVVAEVEAELEPAVVAEAQREASRAKSPEPVPAEA